MSSQAQIDANRLNAQKSTGPKTPEGKAAVRFNALSHGLTARAVLFPSDDPEQLHQVCERYLASWQDEHQRFVLEQMAVIQLQMARLREIEVELYVRNADSPIWHYKLEQLDRMSRVSARLERHYLKCAAELRVLDKKSSNQTQSTPEPDKTDTSDTSDTSDTPETPIPPREESSNQTQSATEPDRSGTSDTPETPIPPPEKTKSNPIPIAHNPEPSTQNPTTPQPKTRNPKPTTQNHPQTLPLASPRPAEVHSRKCWSLPHVVCR